nr:hypothetical protein Iba_chr10eCG13140 [Ipomoea batatas]
MSSGASSTTSAGWSAPILAKHPPLQLKYFYILFMGDKIRFKPIFNDVKIKEKKIEFKTTYGVAAGSGGGWAGAAAGSGSWAVAGSAGGGWAGRRGPCGEAVAVRGAVGEGRATLTELRWPVQLRRRRSDGGDFGAVLVRFWCCFGYALEIFCNCFGHVLEVLEIFCSCFGAVLVMFWRYFGAVLVLEIFCSCFGHVLQKERHVPLLEIVTWLLPWSKGDVTVSSDMAMLVTYGPLGFVEIFGTPMVGIDGASGHAGLGGCPTFILGMVAA